MNAVSRDSKDVREQQGVALGHFLSREHSTARTELAPMRAATKTDFNMASVVEFKMKRAEDQDAKVEEVEAMFTNCLVRPVRNALGEGGSKQCRVGISRQAEGNVRQRHCGEA